ncbi:hypothetical protein K449DRAFT_381511 [Hypoxylon sp. EC38]|nr:hypothetical protein K449DRAFT_381511 [Hypoxylon sp. EC38]
MTDSTTKRKLFEAVIWRFLVRNIFSLDGLVWAGSAREHLRKMSRVLIGMKRTYFPNASRISNRYSGHIFNGAISLEDYHAWRAKSAVILSPLSPQPPSSSMNEDTRIDDLTLGLEQQLQPYQVPKYDLDARPNTWEIIKDAVEIDILLKRSRADYQVFMYHGIECHDFSRISAVETYGFEFKETLMDREDGVRPSGKNDNRVHLVVSPMVVKKGTAEGDRYDQQTIISKKGVLCR